MTWEYDDDDEPTCDVCGELWSWCTCKTGEAVSPIDRAKVEQHAPTRCGINIGAYEVCPCTLLAGHSGLHACKHTTQESWERSPWG